MKKLIMYYGLIFCLLPKATFSQQSINASGGDAAGSGYSINFSVGQSFYTTSSGSGGTVYQGIQIPYEITVVTSIENTSKFNLELNAYPNPVTSRLTLKIDHPKKANYQAFLYNNKAELLEIIKIVNNETYLEMGKYGSSVYFLKISDGTREVKTFKIVKK